MNKLTIIKVGSMNTTTATGDFNPQELLNRLRANRQQQGNSNSNSNNITHHNHNNNHNVYPNMKAQSIPTTLPQPPPPSSSSSSSSSSNTHSSMMNTHLPHSMNASSKSMSTNSTTGQTIKSPVGLTLTPNQVKSIEILSNLP